MRTDKAMIVVGAFVAVLAIVLYETPGIFLKVSISEAHSVCSSSLGLIGESLSNQVASDCGNIGTGFIVILLAGIAGLVVAGIGAVRVARGGAHRG